MELDSEYRDQLVCFTPRSFVNPTRDSDMTMFVRPSVCP